jgi:hypothetical protein
VAILACTHHLEDWQALAAGLIVGAERNLLPAPSPQRPTSVPDRHGAGAGERTSSSSRAVQRLRAWVVCLSFAVCLPAASRWELSWPVRAVATLVSVAVGVAPLPRSNAAALAAGSHAPARAAVLVAPWASAGVLAEPPCDLRERAPGFDGRQLYLELCTLTC